MFCGVDQSYGVYPLRGKLLNVRDASVRDSHFRWIGDTAIACWGKTDELGDGGRAGMNATAGNFPVDTVIDSNIVREVGMWEKQSSMYFHAKAARTRVTKNLFFNGPRAGINFNDGLGGGDVVEGNAIFNTCREVALALAIGSYSNSHLRVRRRYSITSNTCTFSTADTNT